MVGLIDFVDDVFRHIVDLLRYYPKGYSAFRQLLAYLDHQKIIIPAYSTLQDLFSQAFSVEEKRLYSIIANISGSINEQLLGLIQNQGTITELNAIRSDQKDFQYTAIKEEV